MSALGLEDEYEEQFDEIERCKDYAWEAYLLSCKECSKATDRIREIQRANKPVVAEREELPGLPVLPDGKSYDFTPMGAASLFASFLGDGVRYAHGWDWLLWTGKKWEIVPDTYQYPLAKSFADEVYLACDRQFPQPKENDKDADEKDNIRKKAMGWAKSLRNPTGIESMLKLVKSEYPVLSRVEQYDLDKDLLNSNNGIINLKTGELLPHDRRKYITRLAPVDYMPGAKSELWESCINRVMDNDKEMAESKLKDLTGGDTITCRRLYKDPVSFKPEFSIFIYGNHKIEVTGQDYGIWRRIKMIPFDVTIAENERIKGLDEILKEPEHQQGILAWLVEGAQKWYQDGLESPKKVIAATQEYQNESDVLGAWIDDCCNVANNKEELSSKLLENYNNWAYKSGEKELSQRSFSSAMEIEGFTKTKKRDGRYFCGISLVIATGSHEV